MGRGLLGVAAYAVGLGDDAAVGVGRRIGEASGETALPFLANRFSFFTVTIGGLRRRLVEAFDLEASPSLGGLRVGSRISQSGLQPALPLLPHRFDFGRPQLRRLCFCLPLDGFALLGEPIHHLRSLGLKVRLQARTECVNRGTKIVIGHFRHYRDGPRASQASSSAERTTLTATVV